MATTASPSGVKKSYSVQQRERGNTFYKSATDNFGTTIRLLRLDNALMCYRNALDWKNTEDEEVSAMKNIGMTSWKMACVYLERAPMKEKMNVRKYFKDGLKYLCLAYKNRFCKELSWSNKLEEFWEKCMNDATDWLATMDTEERLNGFSELLDYIPDCRLKANGYIQYATLLFHEGLTAWQGGEYKECFRYMKECYTPIQEAERLNISKEPFILTEINVLREDVFTHTCMAESIMARVSGDDLLKNDLNEQETINTDTIWTVIDFYKQAAVLCRDKDLEQEAIAYSRLGHVYGKVLSLPSRGKDYYKQAIQLALSMTPRTFHGVGWFMESTAFVEEFQRKLHKEENDDSEMKAALKEMKEDVDKLEEMVDTQDDDLDFVKLIYKTWPPKTPGAKLNENLSYKKLLLKAISHYHPDKVDKEIHGKNWFYFSGEITKHLNRRYMVYKPGCD